MGQIVNAHTTLYENAKLYSKLAVLFYIPEAMYKRAPIATDSQQHLL